NLGGGVKLLDTLVIVFLINLPFRCSKASALTQRYNVGARAGLPQADPPMPPHPGQSPAKPDAWPALGQRTSSRPS
ncbi:MAG: hypothetical protein L0Y56_06875, partial [Nitrospira sp.]|nr:hypothetical protein [Nitrospira sp.]